MYISFFFFCKLYTCTNAHVIIIIIISNILFMGIDVMITKSKGLPQMPQGHMHIGPFCFEFSETTVANNR